MTPATENVTARARDLQQWIAKGKILEALDEFYAEDVEMQENTDTPCRGRAKNIEREKEWLDTVDEFLGFEVKALAADGDTSFVESVMDYRTKDGQTVHVEQVSRAHWKDGRIVRERFYHS